MPLTITPLTHEIRAAFEEPDEAVRARLDGALVEHDFSYSRGLVGFEFTAEESAEFPAMRDDPPNRAERHGHGHDWRQGDAIVWDNQAAVHRATAYDGARHRRLMRRTTISSRNEAAA